MMFSILLLFFGPVEFLAAYEWEPKVKIESRAVLNEDGKVFGEFFLLQETDQIIHFGIIYNHDMQCLEKDGSAETLGSEILDQWGNSKTIMEFGLLVPGQWSHREALFDFHSDLREMIKCTKTIGLHFCKEQCSESEPYNEIFLDIDVDLTRVEKGWNNLQLENSYRGASVEVERLILTRNRAFVSFMFRNKSNHTVSIQPLKKFISCPEIKRNFESSPVQWDYYGAESIGGMHTKFVSSLELAAFTDVISISKNDSWRACSLFYQFSDGHDSTFDIKLDLSESPIGYREQLYLH